MTVAPSPVRRGASPRAHRSIQPYLWTGLVLAVAAVTLVLLVRHDSRSGDSAVRGSNSFGMQRRTVPPFGSVELAGANRVNVAVGAERSVVVHGDDNLLALVRTEVRAGTLVVTEARSFSTRTPMSVDVTVPSLSEVVLSGAGSLAVRGVDAARFVARLSGSGLLSASGHARAVEATLTGTGNLELQQLESRDARAVLVGSGRISVRATRSLDASVSGTGAIAYSGGPTRIARSVGGTGTIVPAG